MCDFTFFWNGTHERSDGVDAGIAALDPASAMVRLPGQTNFAQADESIGF
jgi:hypothetical protein